MPEPMIGEEDVARAIVRGIHLDCCEGEALDDTCALPLSDGDRQTARFAISAHLAALERAGWVVVPRKPTPEMSDAAFQIEAGGHSQRTLIEAGWEAMIAAAHETG